MGKERCDCQKSQPSSGSNQGNLGKISKEIAKERKMSAIEVEITSERIDDIPLIVEWLQQLGIAKQIDKNLSRRHGNHQGLSYGQLSVLLLTYMITQQDHRLCAVEPWVKTHQEILELSTGWTIGEKDASDDRLARVVEELGKQEEARQAIERKVGKLMIRAALIADRSRKS